MTVNKKDTFAEFVVETVDLGGNFNKSGFSDGDSAEAFAKKMAQSRDIDVVRFWIRGRLIRGDYTNTPVAQMIEIRNALD